jgi:hypothetical protein
MIPWEVCDSSGNELSIRSSGTRHYAKKDRFRAVGGTGNEFGAPETKPSAKGPTSITFGLAGTKC